MANSKELEDLFLEYQKLDSEKERLSISVEKADKVSRKQLKQQIKEVQKQLNKVGERIGELNAELYIEKTYNTAIKQKVQIPRRGTEGVVILDLVYELENREIIVIEAKFNLSLRGMSKDVIFVADDTSIAQEYQKLSSEYKRLVNVSKNADRQTLRQLNKEIEQVRKQLSQLNAATTIKLPEQIEQLSGPWLQARIDELNKRGHKQLAKSLQAALDAEKLTVLEIRTFLTQVGSKLEGIVEVTDETQTINNYKKSGRPVITDRDRGLYRKIGKEEAWLTIERDETKRKAKSLDEQAKNAESKAKQAKKATKTAEKKLKKARKRETVEKRQKLADDKLKTAQELRLNAIEARQATDRASKDLTSLEKELKKQTEKRKAQLGKIRTAELVDKIAEANATRAEASKITEANAARIEASATDAARLTLNRGIENSAIGSETIVNTASGDLRTLERAVSEVPRVAKVFTFTKNIGKLVIALFVPLSFLDLAFLIALEIFEWDRKRRAFEKEEWNRIINFLLGDSKPIGVPFIGSYSPGIGDVVREKIYQTISNQNKFMDLLNKWNGNKKWGGVLFMQKLEFF